jgi:signal transduction histidine kinase
VHGDPIALRRILENLIRNAVESLTNAGGSVTVQLEPISTGVRLVVSDTGRGMTESELARAFDDFHTSKPTGTGLGLSVVRRLASDIGATLRIDTKPNQGTSVTLEMTGGDGITGAHSPAAKHRSTVLDSRFPAK